MGGIDTTTTGTQYFDAFESRRQTPIGSGTSLPEAIFANDFESGNLNYWTSSTGSPTVTTAASLAPTGIYGMQVTIDGATSTTARYVTDSTPTYESRYRARFYFDPNSITMANNAAHYLLYADSGTTAVLRLEFGYTTANGYRLRVAALNNSTTWTTGTWVNIADAPHVIELDWQSSTTGSLNWWIDETPQTALTGFDNSARRIDRVRLGAVAGVDATTNGTLYFDAFESRRSTYIGPMPSPVVTTTINYVYDPLYRLKEANYSDGRYFRYTYDSVGNRLSEEKCAVLPCGTPITNTYVYDSANRLTSVNGQTYQWDNNGNLLSDGTSTYTYDAANRLTSVSNQSSVSSYQYNGLGDRLSQTVDSVTTNYVLDLNAGLTQVLSDGSNTYLYGAGRIGELQPAGFAYHLGDALGSVRQLADATGTVTLARSFEPFGSVLSISSIDDHTAYGFTGEWADATELMYLRARYIDSTTGRFLQADSWRGDSRNPQTLNKYVYALNNPLRWTDPSGTRPNKPGIQNDEYTYSCNCGWIDWRHADPNLVAKRVIDEVNNAVAYFNQPGVDPCRDEYRIIAESINQNFEVPKLGSQPTTTTDVIVYGKINSGNKYQVAMGIFRWVSENHEGSIYSNLSNVADWEIAPLQKLLKQMGGENVSSTWYSEEDLTSDLIAFYRALDPANHNEDNAKATLAPICGFPTDRDERIAWSLDVLDEYPNYEPVLEWESPRFVSTPCIDERCGPVTSRAWPSELSTIQPIESEVWIRWFNEDAIWEKDVPATNPR